MYDTVLDRDAMALILFGNFSSHSRTHVDYGMEEIGVRMVLCEYPG